MVNPYTFISIDKKGVKKPFSEYLKNNTLTGKISCELITKTPLAIPGVPENPNDNHKKYPFFRIAGNAAIYGSSLRGLIRNNFEIMTNSCMRTDNEFFYSSSKKSKTAGLLKYENGKFVLYKAERHIDKKKLFDGKKTGDSVSFSSSKDKKGRFIISVSSGENKGYYIRMNEFQGKNKKTGKPTYSKPSVFTIFHKECDNVPAKAIECFEENIRKFVKNENTKSGYAKKYEECYSKIKDGRVVPVWFEKTGNNYYLSLSQLSRNVYTKRPMDFLRDKTLDQCTSSEKLCEACALFGFIEQDSKRSSGMASRVRITDGICLSNDAFDGEHIFDILGSPRLSSFEFYLIGKGNQIINPDDGSCGLRGRKGYWHHKDFKYSTSSNIKSNMNATFETVKENKKFTFDVYFENITHEELQKLTAAVTLGENSINSNICSKLGHGKPLGYGSVKMIVNKIIIRKFNEQKYEICDVTGDYITDDLSIFGNDNTIAQFRRLCSFNAISGEIAYPYNNDKSKVFDWFSKNNKIDNTNYKQILPSIMKDDQNLSKTSDKKY